MGWNIYWSIDMYTWFMVSEQQRRQFIYAWRHYQIWYLENLFNIYDVSFCAEKFYLRNFKKIPHSTHKQFWYRLIPWLSSDCTNVLQIKFICTHTKKSVKTKWETHFLKQIDLRKKKKSQDGKILYPKRH